MTDQMLKFSHSAALARSQPSSLSAQDRSNNKPPQPAFEPPTQPMVTQHELEELLKRDFSSSEDVYRHAEQRKREFDKEWGIPAGADDDFSPLTR